MDSIKGIDYNEQEVNNIQNNLINSNSSNQLRTNETTAKANYFKNINISDNNNNSDSNVNALKAHNSHNLPDYFTALNYSTNNSTATENNPKNLLYSPTTLYRTAMISKTSDYSSNSNSKLQICRQYSTEQHSIDQSLDLFMESDASNLDTLTTNSFMNAEECAVKSDGQRQRRNNELKRRIKSLEDKKTESTQELNPKDAIQSNLMQSNSLNNFGNKSKKKVEKRNLSGVV